MADDLVFEITLPKKGNKFPDNFPISELEQAMQDSFATRRMKVVSGYFEEGNDYYPKNLSFFIFARYNGNRNGNGNRLVGGLIATDEKAGNFEFKYYDKIFVIPKYMGNGIMPSLVKIARQVSSNGKNVLPAILRTSDEGLDESYGRLSDIPSYGVNWHANGYYVRGFGFLDKNGKEMFKGAENKFNAAAKYVSSKPATVIHTGQDSGYKTPAPLEMRLNCLRT